jgi:signal transduction histidine kinase
MAALALPVLGLAVITGAEIVQGVRDRDRIQDQARLARAATGPNGLLTAIQNERNRAAVYLLGQGGVLRIPCEDNAGCRQATDTSLERFRSVIPGQGDKAESAYAPALDALDALEPLRSDIDADAGPFALTNTIFTNQVFQRYTELVDALLSANTKVSLAIEDPELRRGADLSYMASWQTDLMARVVQNYVIAAVSGGLGTEDLQHTGGLYQLAARNYADIRTIADGKYAAAADQLVADESATGFLDRIAPQVLETGQVTDLRGVLASVSVNDDEGFYGFRESVKQVLDSEADDLTSAADRRTQLFSALGVAVLAAAIFATWLVSRSITRPLRALTGQAADMANHRLPDAVSDILDRPLGDDVTVPEVDPVQVQTRDEVADVATALNTVQDSALDLAVEQAVLRRNIADSFVNLGRRNQNLLGRQLDFITELETKETDPDTLSNLFRLDHLATRMRRNAESLLVLAGIDPARKWAAPVRVTDTIRAALGEVEDYQRVTIRAVDPATIQGTAAADLAHLLAELIENALVFSPPDQTVEIRGRYNIAAVTPEAPAAGSYPSDHPAAAPSGVGQHVGRHGTYSLAVIDAGLGMPPEELARANRRLAGAESFTIAPSKYLGHYVAGNLAARHGITVTLHTSPGPTPGAGHGITVVITLPAALLAHSGDSESGNGHDDFAPMVPPAPADPAPRPLELASLVGASSDGAPTRTASGLAKRNPRPSEGSGDQDAHSIAGAPPTGEFLDALASYTREGQDGAHTPSGLTRRVRGAQLPRPLTVRRSQRDEDGGSDQDQDGQRA